MIDTKINTRPKTLVTTTLRPKSASYSWENNLPNAPTSQALDEKSTPHYCISPLAFSYSVSAQSLLTLDNNDQCSRQLIDGFIRELHLRAPNFHKRPVNQINFRLPLHHIDAADFTEMIYHLGQQFNVSNSTDSYRSIEITVTDATVENLALFKGLGINAIHLYCDNNGPSPKDLKEIFRLIDDFDFPHLSLVTKQVDADLPLRLRETMLLLEQMPESIQLLNPLIPDKLVPETNDSQDFELFYLRCKDLGYRVLGNDYFVRPDSALATAQNHGRLRRTILGYNHKNIRDVVGFGPGNVSQIAGINSHNPNDFNQYLSHKYQRVPCHVSLSLPKSLKLTVDLLLCYHKLDLRYLKDRYQLNLERTLPMLWAPIETQCDQNLYTLCGEKLYLSGYGILHLSHLCQAMIDGKDTLDKRSNA